MKRTKSSPPSTTTSVEYQASPATRSLSSPGCTVMVCRSPVMSASRPSSPPLLIYMVERCSQTLIPSVERASKAQLSCHGRDDGGNTSLMRISVVIPALNEAGNIGRLIEETYATVPADYLAEVIVVDDASE